MFYFLSTIFSPIVAHAQAVCRVNGEVVPCDSGIFPYLGIIFPIILVLFVFVFVFWIRMIIDVAKRDIPEKTTWVLIVVLLNWLGGLIYYFTIKRPETKKEKLVSQNNMPIAKD